MRTSSPFVAFRPTATAAARTCNVCTGNANVNGNALEGRDGA
jgi:hypothetical protein